MAQGPSQKKKKKNSLLEKAPSPYVRDPKFYKNITFFK